MMMMIMMMMILITDFPQFSVPPNFLVQFARPYKVFVLVIQKTQDFYRNYQLRWPNSVFACTLADMIQCAQGLQKTNTLLIQSSSFLFAKCLHYLCYFSS